MGATNINNNAWTMKGILRTMELISGLKINLILRNVAFLGSILVKNGRWSWLKFWDVVSDHSLLRTSKLRRGWIRKKFKECEGLVKKIRNPSRRECERRNLFEREKKPFNALISLINGSLPKLGVCDSWKWNGSPSGCYNTKDAYNLIRDARETPQINDAKEHGSKLLWNSVTLLKVIVHSLRVLWDRLQTKANLHKRNSLLANQNLTCTFVAGKTNSGSTSCLCVLQLTTCGCKVFDGWASPRFYTLIHAQIC